jgi:hypothetical protein
MLKSSVYSIALHKSTTPGVFINIPGISYLSVIVSVAINILFTPVGIFYKGVAHFTAVAVKKCLMFAFSVTNIMMFSI